MVFKRGVSVHSLGYKYQATSNTLNSLQVERFFEKYHDGARVTYILTSWLKMATNYDDKYVIVSIDAAYRECTKEC